MRQKIRIVTLAAATLGALAAFIACGSSVSRNPAAGDGPPVIARIAGSGAAFAPNSVTVGNGASVAWTNADSASHTATADNGSFDTGTIVAGTTSAPIPMDNSGTFTFHCSLHPGEVGTLIVQ
jgi:plastocyanin